MHPVEEFSLALRHSRPFANADWLWDRTRPVYDLMLARVGRHGLRRTINGTDEILILPRLRGILEQYEAETWNCLMSQVRPGDVVADVGAFIGLYTVALAKRVGPAGKVVAFEPDSENFALLQAQLGLNGIGDRVELFQMAVGAENVQVRFASGRDSQSRVVAQSGAQSRSIEGVTLDRVFNDRRLDLVKIDVEGYEERVLRGALNLLQDERRRPRSIFVEMHPTVWEEVGTTSASLLHLLTGCGYHVTRLDGHAVTQVNVWGEIMATRALG